jgi:transcriptional regulator of arginine metabolism
VSTPRERREAVARILRSRSIGTQEELLEALRGSGIAATQATLSRDLARLGARRVSRPGGGTVYELAEGNGEVDGFAALRGLVSGIAWNATIVVIRTHPGSAPAIARAIDLAEVPEVLGTIAGDDTVFVAPAGELRPRRLAARLAQLLGVRPSAPGAQRPAPG